MRSISVRGRRNALFRRREFHEQQQIPGYLACQRPAVRRLSQRDRRNPACTLRFSIPGPRDGTRYDIRLCFEFRLEGRVAGRGRGITDSSRPLESENTLRVKAWMVHQILCEEYRCPIRYFHDMDPVSELISSLLSHRTRNSDSGRAFKALRATFGTWEAVRDAETADVETAIAAVTWPEQKAPRIQHVLREITRLRGELSLDFLADMPVVQARAWLEQLPGIGPKTSAATLLFSRLRMPALPVDSEGGDY